MAFDRLLPAHITIAIASGKGGTGKTLVATNLSVTAARAGTPSTLVDCDAEAPNDALFVPPDQPRSAEVEVPVPVVDAAACNLCGICRDACAYGAIRILGGSVMVFPELCHGCGACVTACVRGAIKEEPRRVGEVEWGRVSAAAASSVGLEVVTGRLDVGEVKTPTLVRAARERGRTFGSALSVLDAPPGVSCATVAAVRDADALVLVTEPTPFGLHDLALAVDLGRQMQLPIGVVINRDGSGPTNIGAYCQAESLPVLARIPFDRRVAEIYARGGLVIDEHPEGAGWFDGLWNAVRSLVAWAYR